MDSFLQRVYVTEIKSQGHFALNAVSALNQALQATREFDGDWNRRNFFHAEVFRQTHSFLTHASNISRLFWPPQPRKRRDEAPEAFAKRQVFTESRGTTQLALFGLDASSPLKSRVLRDHLEHYDERLDHWSNTSERRNIASDTIGPPNAIVGLDPSDTMRWFDPTTNAFRFRGEAYALQPLATAVDQLLSKAASLEESLWRQLGA
ncbi:hypothetical protein [Salinisphaera hydrothermalis]|uniref:hypothetical protein n=1 Tax=Salinisphaera hydrothermalis TaxID=563188 RepID=UPI00333F065C